MRSLCDVGVGLSDRLLTQHLLMSLQMESQVVRPGERPLTELTSVRPDPGMFPCVSSKFVRSGELPATAGPGADVGLLSGVRPQVGLHVAGLVVGLAAVVVGTVVDLRNLPASPHFSHLHWQLESCRGGDQVVGEGSRW